MNIHGSAALSDLLAEFVAYRGLRPADARLPGLPELAAALGLLPRVPRKGDAAYAQIVAALLQAARSLGAPGVPLQRLVVVGDTRGSDGGAFTTIRAATGWQARAFIGAEDQAMPAAMADSPEGITFANRWALLGDFATRLEAEGFVIDQATAIMLDIDKTLLGARGRNDHSIDQARLEALRACLAEALGAGFDEAEFRACYQAFNQSRFHPVTGDNQDYVGYLCLAVGGGLTSRARLEAELAANQLPAIDSLINQIDAAGPAAWPTAAAATLHQQIAERVAAGDPTPFKAFRRREFSQTAARMGAGPAASSAELLADRLVLTAEVWRVAQGWQARGALLFGLSDKPDEAALPAAEGVPLHRLVTPIVGE